MIAQRLSIITGGAGFIGANLTRQLLDKNHKVIVLDNFSLGTLRNIEQFKKNKNFSFIKCDLSVSSKVDKTFSQIIRKNKKIDEIWHLAANSDIPAGVDNARIDYRDTFLTTFETLQSSKKYGVKRFYFASSSAVYGDWGSKALSESLGPLKPISNYGAMKLASEGQICAAADDFLEKAMIYRFPNVVGTPATHGVIYDFVLKIKKNKHLDVLGDGTQKKSYLHVNNLVSAMLFLSESKETKKMEIINIGSDDEGIQVSRIAELVRDKISEEAQVIYGKTNKGWQGDVPRFFYDISYLRSFGWDQDMSSESAVIKAVDEIIEQLK